MFSGGENPIDAIELVRDAYDSIPRVSVCIATYNGELYIKDQLSSILDQISKNDEIIVVDDASSDATVELIQSFQDSRIKIFTSDHNMGYVKSFQKALSLARGEYLFLSDQDDVWNPGRVHDMCHAMETSAVVATNLGTLNSGPFLKGPFGQKNWQLREKDSKRHFLNILAIIAGNRPYYGCAMAVRRDALDVALPFPHYLHESHDLWLALVANMLRSISHLEIRSLDRRIHETNQTPIKPRKFTKVMRSRVLLLKCLIELIYSRRTKVSKFRNN